MLEPLSLPAINRLLRASSWALETLRPHAGKTALLICPPVTLRLTVLETGEFGRAPNDATPDVTISASPGVLLRLAARDEAARQDIAISGDVQFAAAIDYLRRNLVWDWEEDLSHVVGDIAAHRIAEAGRDLDRWGRAALHNLGLSLAEYWTHERPLVASAQVLDEYYRDVDRLRDDTDRLEKRLDLLQRRLSPGATRD
jgi:ubiquinone biosynthesis accessory factor UbiJ